MMARVARRESRHSGPGSDASWVVKHLSSTSLSFVNTVPQSEPVCQ